MTGRRSGQRAPRAAGSPTSPRSLAPPGHDASPKRGRSRSTTSTGEVGEAGGPKGRGEPRRAKEAGRLGGTTQAEKGEEAGVNRLRGGGGRGARGAEEIRAAAKEAGGEGRQAPVHGLPLPPQPAGSLPQAE